MEDFSESTCVCYDNRHWLHNLFSSLPGTSVVLKKINKLKKKYWETIVLKKEKKERDKTQKQQYIFLEVSF